MLTDLALDLSARGLDVAVVTSRQRIDQPDAPLAQRENVGGVAVHRVWSTRFGRSGFVGRLFDYLTFHYSVRACLRRLCRAGDVLVSKTDPPLLSVTVGRFAQWRHAVHCTWLQDLFPEVASVLGVPGLDGALGRKLQRWRDRSLQCAAMNVVPGESVAARVRESGASPARVQVIHNWSDGEAIRRQPRGDSALRREWGLQRRFVVVYAGNLGLAHDFQTLLEAGDALAHDDRFRFVMIGGGLRMTALRDAVSQRALRNFLFESYQPRDRLVDTLGLADVHLVTLRPDLEGLIVPSKIYGVLAAGRPVVHIGATDGEIAGLIRAAGCGDAVAQGDVPALVKLLHDLADDPIRCEKLGAAARRAFDRHYSMSRGLDAWYNTLRQLAPPANGVSG